MAVLAAGILVTSAGAIGAQSQGCGSFSYGFTGTRLLNDGISDSAGPFSIDLPAGTYDITMFSNDHHPTADYQVEQTQEQWYFRLDNGYVSPPTFDIPADQTHTTTSIGAVELASATAISVHHLSEGGINSVNVECVGFTPASVEVAAPAAAAPTTEAPETEVLAAVQAPPVAQLAVTGSSNVPMVLIGLAIIGLGLAILHIEHRITEEVSRT